MYHEHKLTGILKNGTSTGIFSHENGHAYIGGVLNGQFHGVGIAICPDQGDFYATFKNGKMEGHVLMSSMSTDTYYMGEYNNNNQHGFGERKRDDEAGIFRGQYEKGERQGRGRFIRRDGTAADTMWRDSTDTGTPCDVSDILPCVDDGSSLFHHIGVPQSVGSCRIVILKITDYFNVGTYLSTYLFKFSLCSSKYSLSFF